MPRSILSSLCFVLIPGFCLLALYNIQTANFRQHMQLNTLQPEPASVTPKHPPINFGSTVTVRHLSSPAGGYLHSHALFYPAGSQQQQVTLAPERSAATAWRIYNATVANYETREQDALQAPRQPVMAASSTKLQHAGIKLQHAGTGKHLHSHDVPPPVSTGDHLQEVTAYGLPGFPGDANDHWFIELTEGSVLTTMSPFRLRHYLTRCFLSARGETLPEWGLGLQEVVCELEKTTDGLWIIEEAL
ncbi:MIR motif-containing protein [Mycena epipterygia]|nr:MIR motif-containing protein [Mycena epipterygia]